MAEERTAKLKLKRKKCTSAVQGAQEAHVKLPSLPASDLRQSSAGCWFDEIDLTTAEQLWKQVLTCVSPDLGSVGWGSVPGLPDFAHQVAEEGQKTTTTEAFERFEWYPLPAPRPPTITHQPRTTDLESETGRSHEQPAEPVFSKSRNPIHTVNRVEIGLTVPSPKENNQVGNNKNPTRDCKESQIGTTRNVKEPMAFQASSAGSVKAPLASQGIKTPPSLHKGRRDHLKEPQSSEKRPKKAAEGPHGPQKGSAKDAREPQALPKQTYHLWPTVSLAKGSKAKEEPRPAAERASWNDDVMDIDEELVSASGRRQQVMQESADKATGAAGSLEKCPICLMPFPKQFSQLDMDSHLAQCLSETTVDVVW